MMSQWPWAKVEWRAVCAERCTYGSGRGSAHALPTPLRLQEEFAYLAVVLDAFSRRVVGWAMASHLRAELAVAALDMAIADRRPAPDSLIHHSDRGVQGGFKRSSQQPLSASLYGWL